jgi:gluconokinase
MGVYKNLEEAAQTVLPENTYEPSPENHKVYQRYFEIFERLSSKLVNEFEDIARLQQLSTGNDN